MTIGTCFILIMTPNVVISLKGTVDDMWNAGVYPLAILIAFFSAAWPYVKLAVMLAAWVLPNRLWSAQDKAYYLQVCV